MSAPVAERSARAPQSPAPSEAAPASGLVGFNGIRTVPRPVNEPVRSYAAGAPDRVALKARLHAMATERVEIPIIIGGEE